MKKMIKICVWSIKGTLIDRAFFNKLSDLPPKEQVKAINDWLVKFNPEARPAYLKDGEVVIPRPLLKKKTASKNIWLKK